MSAEQYIRDILRQVHTDRKTKRRLREDLTQDIEQRMADGQPLSEIMREMGDSSTVAAHIQEGCVTVRPRTGVEKAVLVLCVALALFTVYMLVQTFTTLGILWALIAPNASVGIIGGADGPTAVFTTSQLSPLTYIGFALPVAAIACFVLYLLLRRRK